MILCLDPGATAAGVALFDDKTLTRAYLARGKCWVSTADDLLHNLGVPVDSITEVVIEKMQVYKETPVKWANDLITVSLMGGRVSGFFPQAEIKTYLPRDWKGGAPKAIMTKRIMRAISDVESDRIENPSDKSLTHNVIDAIGIGVRRIRGIHALGK